MNLELGSGDRPYGGDDWVHNDERDLPHIELVGAAEHISQLVEPDSVDCLRAAHLLEHFSWRDTSAVLEDWYKVIRPGGQIWIEVPSLEWQAQELLEKSGAYGAFRDEHMVEFIYGSQNYPGNYHKAAFTVDLLRQKLEDAGFVDVEVYQAGQILDAHGTKAVR